MWLVSGPWFDWSDTWQLIINSITNVSTFVVVFMIQSTQTRDTQAMHVKLDEIMRALGKARLIDIEDHDPKEIEQAKEAEKTDPGQ